MAKEYRVAYVTGNQWKLPLNLAIGFHVLIGLSAIYLPGLLEPKPRFEDIYTVNLVNLTEVAAPQLSQPEVAPQPVAEPEPPVEKAVSLAPPPPVETSAPPQKAISLKPLKKKKKKKIVQKVDTSQEDRLKRQKLAEMLKAQQEADRQARLLAEEAERERKMLETTRKTIAPPSRKPAVKASNSAAGSSGQFSSVEKQYYATLKSRLMSLWSLPEYKNWDPSLKASVVITIRKNGEIADSFFESKSGDILYDRFVMKTLQEIGQLPPIPPVLKKQRMEIGLIFTPGKIR